MDDHTAVSRRLVERPWTEAEELLVVKHAKLTNKELAYLLGRSSSSVKNHRFRMRRDGRLPGAKNPPGRSDQERPPCEKCGQRHRKPAPGWLPEAIDVYRRYRVPVATVAREIGENESAINWWLKHEGVIRSQSEARSLAIRRLGLYSSAAQPRSPIRQTGCRALRARQFTGQSRRFQEDARQRLKELGWDSTRFKRETGIAFESVFDRNLIRPEYVATTASALGMDPWKALQRAGWDIRTLLQRRIVEGLQRLKSHEELACRAGISRGLVGLYLHNPDMTPTDETLERLAPLLRLSAEDKAVILASRRPKAPVSAEAHRRAIDTIRSKNPNHWRESGKIAGRASWADSDAARERARRAGEAKSAHIDREAFAAALARCDTYGQMAAELNVAPSTVRKYAGIYRMHTDRGQLRRERQQAARARTGHRKRADARLEAAHQLLEDLGDGVLGLSRRRLQEMVAAMSPSGKALDNNVAGSLLREAKAKALSRLTIAS